MSWLQGAFGVDKPIIALLHLRAFPGDPLYRGGGIEPVLEAARTELAALQDGGVDGVLFANEFSLPYEKKPTPVVVAALSYIVGRLRNEIRIPFGVNVVSSPSASIEAAAAVGAQFVRGLFTGVYAGESGFVDTDVASALRRRKALDAEHVRVFFKINPEGGTFVSERPIDEIASSVIFRCAPDGLCVSGANAGHETDSGLLVRAKRAAGDTPVFCNTGCTIENIKEKLEHCDGAFVGTSLKKDGKFVNQADPERVKAFMNNVRDFRAGQQR